MALTVQEIAAMSPTEKLTEAVSRSIRHLPSETGELVKGIFTPASLAILAGTLVVWAGSHAFGVGFFVDLVLLGVGFFSLGFVVFKLAGVLCDFATVAMNARTDQDLEQAGELFAEAIVLGGVGTVCAILMRGASRTVVAQRAATRTVAARAAAQFRVLGEGGRVVESLPASTKIFRFEPVRVPTPMAPHESMYFDILAPMDFGLRPANMRALFFVTEANLPELTALRASQGYFYENVTLRSTTIGELFGRFPGGQLLSDVKFNFTVLGADKGGYVFVAPLP